MENNCFKLLLLLARPAAGKSEIINYLRNIPVRERLEQYHIGNFHELDDFPMLWAWFEEDQILEKMGKNRLHSDSQGYFLHPYFWNVLIERLNLDYKKILRDLQFSKDGHTVLMEFSRGSEHGGYQEAFKHLAPELLKDMAIIYLYVPWEESLRKNRRRFNPQKPDSILEHGLSDEKLEKLYRQNDWIELTNNSPDFLNIQGINVPYCVFENSNDITSIGGELLGCQLTTCLDHLWGLYAHKI